MCDAPSIPPDMGQLYEDMHDRTARDRIIRRLTIAAAIIAAAAVVAVLTAAGTTAHANAVAQAATLGAY